MVITSRKPARRLNIRRRNEALSSNDQVKKRKLHRMFIYVLDRILFPHLSKGQQISLGKVALLILYKYSAISIWQKKKLPKLINYRKTIESFDDMESWNFFETKKEDLYRLKRVLRIPDRVRFSNSAIMNGEEVMLRGLYELVTGENQYNIATNVFGRDQSAQSRAFTWFVNHVHDSFYDLLTDNLVWWYERGYLQKSMSAIKSKCGGNDNFSTCAFIDCNCLECARPGGGPVTDGCDAERWDSIIQKTFYNGWKSIHGLKHQTVDCAYGMTIDMHGPWSLRRNDLHLLRESRINARMRDLQNPNEFQVTIYGDSIYPRLSHLKSSWRNDINQEKMKAENQAYSKIRINIEWNYMVTANLFRYLQNANKLKILGSLNTSRVYVQHY